MIQHHGCYFLDARIFTGDKIRFRIQIPFQRIHDTVRQDLICQKPVFVDQLVQIGLVCPCRQDLVFRKRQLLGHRLCCLRDRSPFNYCELLPGNVVKIALVDGFHHFRQGHGFAENIGIGLQRIIPADSGVDFGAKGVSHQSLLIQDLDYSCRSAALRYRNGHVFVAFAVNCTDPRQIKEHPGSQQDYDDPDDDQKGFQFAAKNL